MTLPDIIPSPFDELGPHPLARRAAEELMARLPPLAEGKMFGVLIARDAAGDVRVLHAFSGMLNGSWELDGFVSPMFDRDARARIEPAGDACVKAMSARLNTLDDGGALRAELARVAERHRQVLDALRARHHENKRLRHAERAATNDARALHLLDQQSRADKAERRAAEASCERELAAICQQLRRIDRRRAAGLRLRAMVSRRLMQQLHDTYAVQNALGATKPMRELFRPGEPPSGAGDCAAPKLLAAAFRAGLVPIALAEFWWGPPPATGGRRERAFYPSCALKCGPLLAFMLSGLAVAPPRRFSPSKSAASLDVLFEDEAFIVVRKPAGVLSVPARDPSCDDSVLHRLRARYPNASGPMIVHRLDLDTSGLMVVALTSHAYSRLQSDFKAREVSKQYVAILDGEVPHDHGTIDLPIRVDLDDRPRQIHDPVHGKRAITHWRVLGRTEGRTRVALQPVTGRTHQLRVHAAHPLGLKAPIVGDRLYGHPGERLMLHAQTLSFAHPITRQALSFTAPAPF